MLGWRNVPVDNSGIGATARRGEPLMRQLFVGPLDENMPEQLFKLQVGGPGRLSLSVVMSICICSYLSEIMKSLKGTDHDCCLQSGQAFPVLVWHLVVGH